MDSHALLPSSQPACEKLEPNEISEADVKEVDRQWKEFDQEHQERTKIKLIIQDESKLKAWLEQTPLTADDLGLAPQTRPLIALIIETEQAPGQNRRCMQMLLDAKADINAQDHMTFGPLHYAVMKSDTDLVSFLLEHRADPNAGSAVGCTPWTFLNPNDERIKVLLLEAGADPLLKSVYGKTMAQHAKHIYAPDLNTRISDLEDLSYYLNKQASK